MTRAYANGIWFVARPAQLLVDRDDEDGDLMDECKGCTFRRKPSTACRAAGEAAVAAGLPDCESRADWSEPGHVYVPAKRRE
jgi:hypothetical protein